MNSPGDFELTRRRLLDFTEKMGATLKLKYYWKWVNHQYL